MSALPPWSECPGVIAGVFMLGGGAVIKGSREPVTSLLEYVQSGMSADDYLEHFVVSPGPVAEVVAWLLDVLLDDPRSERDRATLLEWQGSLAARRDGDVR